MLFLEMNINLIPIFDKIIDKTAKPSPNSHLEKDLCK